MRVPLSPLELRLERNKCISNLSFDFLKRLYDRRSIGERYAAGDMNLHVHGTENGMGCLTCVAGNQRKIVFKASVDPSRHVAAATHEMPVFIRVGALAEAPRPIASVVRLQPLDCCDMSGVDAFEPTSLCVSNEVLWRVYNRKLCAILCSAGIEYGEFEN